MARKRRYGPKSRCVEIDVDGVLADLLNNKHIKRRLRLAYPQYSESCLKSYDFSHLKEENPKAYKLIRRAFQDPAYMGKLPVYDGVSEGLDRLVELDADICIHTLIVGDERVVAVREEWLKDLIKNRKIRYQVDHKIKNMFDRSYILIEDSPENLEKSNAVHKIMVRHSYNEWYEVNNPNIIAVNSFNEAAQIAAGLLSK